MKLTLVNDLRGTSCVLRPQPSGLLSARQVIVTRRRLAMPGQLDAGPLGEHPRRQRPPETCSEAQADGVEYSAVERAVCRRCELPVEPHRTEVGCRCGRRAKPAPRVYVLPATLAEELGALNRNGGRG